MPEQLASLRHIAPLLTEVRSLFVSGCAAQIPNLERVFTESEGRDPLTVSGIFVPGVNTVDYAAACERVRCQTYFMTPQMASADHDRVQYCPWRYSDIVAFYRSNPVDVALVMLSPPDPDGYCSYGVAGDFAPLILPHAGISIAVINPRMPRLPGVKVALASLDYVLEIDSPLLETTPVRIDAVSDRIAENVASFVGDGATVQLGLGNIPSAVARRLFDRRKLRIQSGLVESTVLELDRAGVLCPDTPILSGVALGDQRFYEDLHENPRVLFQPVDVTHDVEAIAATESFIAINGALHVDLLGQVNSSALPDGFISGPGGLPEFVSGTLGSTGGRSIIALNATARGGELSRIVPRLESGLVSVACADADTVVSEFGVAELRGKSVGERVQQMIAIADPRHRESLSKAARDICA